MSGSSPLQSKATDSTTDSSETTSTIIVVRNGTKAKNCIFFSWEDARPHIVDYKGVTYATFDDLEEAMQYLNQSKDDGNYDDKEKIGKKSYLRPIYLDSNLYKCAKEFKYHNTGFSIHWNILTKKMIISTLLKTPLIKYKMNRILTNKACTSGTNRQYKLSCKSEYTSFESLTDNSFYGRHLDPAPDSYVNSLPPIDAVTELFERQRVNNRDGTEREVQTMCPRSTMLFPTFAQYLMDNLIVTATEKGTKESRTEFDWRKTDSPHEIGLLPLYGRTIKQTKQLRVQKPPRGRYGQLKSQMINGEEWAPFLFAPCGKVKDEFNELDYPQGLDHVFEHIDCPIEKRAKKEKIFAFGGARTNLTPNVSAWNVLLLREHNRIARVIERNEPSWDDERIFQTSRNILLVIYLKLVIEEYINHITPYGTDFTVRPGKWMWNAPW
jgi:prostaglandin-endoperoxide synthase 2